MKKIPTVLVRDPQDRAHVLPEVTPGCEWVLAGEGVPTRKYDGTCVMFDGVRWWARREVEPGKSAPSGFWALGADEVTGKVMGYEPAIQSGWREFLAEAIKASHDLPSGTYELCGPRINGNPEGYPEHRLIPHTEAQIVDLPPDLTAQTLMWAVAGLAAKGWEGIVWHGGPDGAMAKLKVRDVSPT